MTHVDWFLDLKEKKTNRFQVDLQGKEECQKKDRELQGKVSGKRL
jgi:hypothetical protein